MPTYDYRCRDCGEDFEIHQSFSDDALTECPSCHGDLRKVFSAVGISFKGSGFYKTDSRSPSKSASGSSSSSGDGSGSSSGATKGSENSSGSSSDSGSPSSGSSGSDSGTSSGSNAAATSS